MARNICICRRQPPDYYNAKTLLDTEPDWILASFMEPRNPEQFDMVAVVAEWSIAYIDVLSSRCRGGSWPTEDDIEDAAWAVDLPSILDRHVRARGVELPEERCRRLDNPA